MNVIFYVVSVRKLVLKHLQLCNVANIVKLKNLKLKLVSWAG